MVLKIFFFDTNEYACAQQASIRKPGQVIQSKLKKSK